MTDRLQQLYAQYPDVSLSALVNLPAGFEGDAAKVHSFAEVWATAQMLSSMLKHHVLGLGRPDADISPQIVGPTFRELAEFYSQGLLQKVRTMAWEQGGIEKAEVAEAFMERVEKVRTLQEDVKTAAEEQTQSRARSR
jgi:hypothetical protein